jgi:hypothetical protein
MNFEIKSWVSGKVLFSLETTSMRLCIEAAVKSGADLSGADLRGADLRGADLRGADLRGADLRGADLRGAYLRDADLSGADLSGADLRGADLRDADLRGADLRGADLRGADLSGADGEPIKRATPEEAVANLDKVREIILDNEERLNMGGWHDDNEWKKRTCAEEAVCGTSHCLAGWLQVCSTDESVRKLDPHLAGIVSAPVAAKMFFLEETEVLAWMKDRKYADEAKEYA